MGPERNCLQLKANLYNGWRELTKTFGFFEQVRFEFRADMPIRIGLQLLPRPSGFQVRSLPDMNVTGGFHGIDFEIKKQILLLSVKMFSAPLDPNPELPWTTTDKGKISLYYMNEQIARVQNVRLELQLNLVFSTPPGPPPPVTRDFSCKLPSAGLPSLGKRR
jgi:hypothetical protein